MTGETLQLALVSGRLAWLGLLLLLPGLFLGAMAAVGAAGDGADHAVMAGIVTGDAADHGALDAALGVGCFGGQRKRGDGEQGGNGFHGGKFLFGRFVDATLLDKRIG
jgi:hypothetical protein